MPLRQRWLSRDDVEALIRRESFTARCQGDVGIELEWLTVRREERRTRLPLHALEQLVADVGPLPHRSRLSIEPGGQLELSTEPHPTVANACAAAADDLFRLDRTCQERGVDLVALGIDPVRDPVRIVTDPRYVAMQGHFDGSGPSGRTMMCNTAAIQVNVGLGGLADVPRRWHIAHRTGPVLLAAFANSSIAHAGDSGWKSARMRAWWGIDPSRSAPVAAAHAEHPDPGEAWVRYALDANVLLIRSGDGWEPVTAPLTLRRWVDEGHPAGWPSPDDVAYHLTTLFPPVRPRGWLELRHLDSLPTPYWHVAVAVTTVLLDDERAADEVLAATEPVPDGWVVASWLGLTDPRIARAADRVFAAAAGALERAGADDATRALVDDYRERYVSRRRCPADDRLDAYRRTGSLHPAAESPIPYAELEAAWR